MIVTLVINRDLTFPHEQALSFFTTLAKKNCILVDRKLGADPSSRWAAYCHDQMG